MSEKFLTRDDILTADDIEIEEIEVPEWGGKVRVRGLSGAERDRFERSVVHQEGKSGMQFRMELANFRAKLVALSIVDSSGKLMFNTADVQKLGTKSAAALQRIFNVAQRLSGLSQSDIEDLTKNSENGQSDGTGLD